MLKEVVVGFELGGGGASGESGGGDGRVDVRERDESVTGVCRQVGLF